MTPEGFDNLSTKDQQKVLNLINKLNNKFTNQTEEIPQQFNEQKIIDSYGQAEKYVRLPPAKQVRSVPQQGTINQKTGRNSRVDLHPKAQQSQQLRRSQANYGTVDPSLPIDAADRPNFFINNGFADMHKKDTAIDKKLAGNNEITQRGVRNDMVQVPCNRCNNIYMVSSKLVYQNDNGLYFICDNCQKSRPE